MRWLDEVFPLREPQLTEAEKEIWYYAGQRSVVRFVEREYEDQTKNVLEDKS